MDAESIAGLIGLGIGLLVLVALSVFESRTYRREHGGEGMLHHWLAGHHVFDAGHHMFDRLRHRR